MLQKVIYSATLLVSSLLMSNTHAASFSCKAAKLKAEQKICHTLVLNDADVRLATTYQIGDTPFINHSNLISLKIRSDL